MLRSRASSDDNEETIRNRMKVYHQQTAPLIDYYAKQDKVRSVNGMGEVDKVSTRILGVLS
ncbi:MAG: nucleoside monophosphate kinase [Deinococcales bacterium]